MAIYTTLRSADQRSRLLHLPSCSPAVLVGLSRRNSSLSAAPPSSSLGQARAWETRRYLLALADCTARYKARLDERATTGDPLVDVPLQGNRRYERQSVHVGRDTLHIVCTNTAAALGRVRSPTSDRRVGSWGRARSFSCDGCRSSGIRGSARLQTSPCTPSTDD